MNSSINMQNGLTYLSAYSIAVKHGFSGSEQDWLDSIGSGNIELRYDDTDKIIYWKNTGKNQWKELISLSQIQGDLSDAVIGEALDEAKGFSKLAQSWAVGGTGTRQGEDSDNAKYWAGVSGSGGSGNPAGAAVNSVNGKTGDVVLSAADVGAAGVVHSHSTTDINSGVLDIKYGGTGGSSQSEAREKLGIGMRGSCATGASAVQKSVDIKNFPGLTPGVIICVRFSLGNTAANPTLSVNGSGAVAINYAGKPITAGMIPAGHEGLLVVATGTTAFPYWELLNPNYAAMLSK